MSSISDIFKSFFQDKSQSVIGIDIGSSSVKLVELKKKSGKAILNTYGEIALGPYANSYAGKGAFIPTDKISLIIKDLLRESNTTTVSSGMSIPVGSSFVVFFRLPVTDPKQLAEMVPIEARKYIPVPITEVTLDWLAIPKSENTLSEFQNEGSSGKDNGTDILLVVIHNDALTRNKEKEKASGLAVSFSEVEVFSSLRVCLEPSLSPQMIIDFGASSTKSFIIEKGYLKASHVVNRGSQDITMSISKSMNIGFDEAEKIKIKQGLSEVEATRDVLEVSSVSVDYILSEISLFMLGFEKKSGKKVSKIVITGGGAMLLGLKDRIKKSFETQIEIADPFSKVYYPAFLEEVLKKVGPEFAVALGVALRKLQEE